MALDSYNGLQDAVADWLNRQDLVGVIPDFIRLFEAQFDADARGRIQPLVVISVASIDEALARVPEDYIQMDKLVNLDATPDPRAMRYVTPYQLNEFVERNVDGPLYYSIVGNQIRLQPVPDGPTNFQMTYFSRLRPLSDTQPDNYLLRSHPNLYLYGTLLQAEPYLKDDERIGIWNRFYEEGMDNLQVTDQRAQASGSPLRMRTRSFG